MFLVCSTAVLYVYVVEIYFVFISNYFLFVCVCVCLFHCVAGYRSWLSTWDRWNSRENVQKTFFLYHYTISRNNILTNCGVSSSEIYVYVFKENHPEDIGNDVVIRVRSVLCGGDEEYFLNKSFHQIWNVLLVRFV